MLNVLPINPSSNSTNPPKRHWWLQDLLDPQPHRTFQNAVCVCSKTLGMNIQWHTLFEVLLLTLCLLTLTSLTSINPYKSQINMGDSSSWWVSGGSNGPYLLRLPQWKWWLVTRLGGLNFDPQLGVNHTSKVQLLAFLGEMPRSVAIPKRNWLVVQ